MALSRTLDRVGLVLGGRYRLLTPIGTGASASVYLADDVTLRRRVAVKVLHEALAEDEAFLRRFQAEAQAAAALNHPHIMSVYDWGDTGEWPYLVMEHLGGGSLRGVLDAAGTLSLSQALLVGLETARGLDYAHRRGFVHRDIKPANLLFDEDARLRIGDFGLARALAEATWTEPMGAVLGTARYASPEQARGESLDGRSDVYSLALVIIEAVTGAVPFRADTTIGTLMARVATPLPVPQELGVLRPVLEAAGRPDPKDRLDAASFGAALLAAAGQLDRPDPIPLPGASLPHEELADRHPTDVRTVAGPPVAPAAAASGLAAAGVTDDITGIVDIRGLRASAAAAPAVAAVAAAPTIDADPPPTWHLEPAGESARPAGPDEFEPFNWQEDSDLGPRPTRRDRRKARKAGNAEPEESGLAEVGAGSLVADPPRSGQPAIGPTTDVLLEEDLEPRRRWPRRLMVAVLVIGLLGGGGFAGWWYAIRIPAHAVPTWVGDSLADAERDARQNNWRVETSRVHDRNAPADDVISQSPPPGTELEEQQIVRLTVSLGRPPVTVPTDLVGRSLDDAGAALAAVELMVGDTERRYDEEAPKDQVLALADGTPAEVPNGGEVALVVSNGPEPRTIPSDLVGQGSGSASASLEALGLDVAIDEEFSETVTRGVVMAVSPGEGQQADKGSTVRLTVSKGPQTVAVPNVTGLSVVDAAARIEAAGLVVSGTQGSPTRTVTGTNPAAGTLVRRGTSVTIATG